MAEMRINQGVSVGDDGISRTDLNASEAIVLEVVEPLSATYLWEVVDAVGSEATLSDATSAVATLGPPEAITQPCSFLIRLTANEGGVVTTTDRLVAVRGAGGLRYPVFSESVVLSNKLSAQDAPSLDNSYYASLGGGAAGTNWKGWAPWAYEATAAVQTAIDDRAGPAAPSTLFVSRGTTVLGSEGSLVVGGGVLEPSQVPEELSLRLMGRLSDGATSQARLTLWDVGIPGSPAPGVLISTITIPAETQPYITYLDQTLTSAPASGTNILAETPRMYELRVELVGGDPSDSFKVHHAGLILTSEEGVTTNVAPSISADPIIVGDPAEGESLVATPSSIQGWPTPSQAFSWIAGPDGGPYVTTPPTTRTILLDRTYLGQVMFFRHTVTSAAGTVYRDSLVTSEIEGAPVYAADSTLSETEDIGIGDTISLIEAAYTAYPAGALTYRWYRDGVLIAGATGVSYTTVEADAETQLSADVTRTNVRGADTSVTAQTSAVSAATPPALLQEDGNYLLQEDGSRILL